MCRIGFFGWQVKFAHVMAVFADGPTAAENVVPETSTATTTYRVTPTSIEQIVPLGIARNGSYKRKNIENLALEQS